MIESKLQLATGTEVRLTRGSLAVEGKIVWSTDDRCGLRLMSQVTVKDWLAPPAKVEQQRIDSLIALVKAGAALPLRDGTDELQVSSATRRSNERLGDDLGVLLRLIQDLEDDLASSQETLERHSLKLQNLDLAMQMVRAIVQEVAPESKPAATSANIDDLRVACAEALRAF